jgi:hypothetical protein
MTTNVMTNAVMMDAKGVLVCAKKLTTERLSPPVKAALNSIFLVLLSTIQQELRSHSLPALPIYSLNGYPKMLSLLYSQNPHFLLLN